MYCIPHDALPDNAVSVAKWYFFHGSLVSMGEHFIISQREGEEDKQVMSNFEATSRKRKK